MGGVDKGLLDYHGEPLVSVVKRRLEPQVSDVLLSANRSQDRYADLGLTPIGDLRSDFPGPLAGLEAGLARCRTSHLLITPCDTPEIPDDLGPRLWRALHAEQADIAHARDSERDHYLHALIPVSLAADLTRYLDRGERAVRHWFADKKVARVRFDDAALANLNEGGQLR